MGNLILCHDRHAAHPYEITRIHSRIFTIEELCYYLCNNLYLIDYTIMNEQLCDWLDEELGMEELAGALKDVLRLRGSVEKFVLTILKASRIYREPEMIRIQNVLEHLKKPEGHRAPEVQRRQPAGERGAGGGDPRIPGHLKPGKRRDCGRQILRQDLRGAGSGIRKALPLSGVGAHV